MSISESGQICIEDEPLSCRGATLGVDLPTGRTKPDAIPAQFPADLLSQPPVAQSDGAGGGESGWWLAHTLPRQEKVVATTLLSRRVAYYLPLVTRKSLVRGRTRVTRIPLFPGYVFVYGADEDRV